MLAHRALARSVVRSHPFLKMSGGGNDFVVLDNRSHWFPGGGEPVVRLCRRALGVGADAVLLLEDDPNADVRMVYYNADGSEAPMCGNGAMCIARYARMIDVATQPLVRVATGSGTLGLSTVIQTWKDPRTSMSDSSTRRHRTSWPRSTSWRPTTSAGKGGG
jgi:diaminopimelate epimerase